MCRDVFAEFRRTDAKALRLQFVEQFGMDQVDLAKIRLSGIDPDAGSVFDLPSLMRVPLDAESGHDLDLGGRLLREAMFAIPRDRNNLTGTHLVRFFLALRQGPAILPEMARSERFELPTLGIEIRCSIQLSYERVRPAYQTWARHAITPGTHQWMRQKQG